MRILRFGLVIALVAACSSAADVSPSSSAEADLTLQRNWDFQTDRKP